jgi:hypothetical protein
VQQGVERLMIADIAAELAVTLRPHRFHLPGGSYVDVDAATPDGTVLIEAYAAVGALIAGRRRKVALDALKLVGLRATGVCRADARLMIALADEAARNSIRGWLAEMLDALGVELVTAELSPDVRDALRAAQGRQRR